VPTLKDREQRRIVRNGIRHGYQKFRGPGWEMVLRAASAYEELNVTEARDF